MGNEYRCLERIDYQYLNSVHQEVYVDISKEGDPNFPKALPPELAAEVSKYAFSSFPEDHYVKEGFALFPLKAGNAENLLCFSKAAVKENAVSVCKYAECAVWKLPESSAELDLKHEILLEQFNELFDFGFYTEAQMDTIAGKKKLGAFGFGDAPACPEKRDIPIDTSAMQTLLCAAFDHWLLGTGSVQIAVPINETAHYSSYVLNSVRKIYSYLPAYLRYVSGFASCIKPAMKKTLANVAFVFVPQEQADSNTVWLDGSSPAAYADMEKYGRRGGLSELIRYICSFTDPQEREDFFDTVYKEIEAGKPMKANDGLYKVLNSFAAVQNSLDNTGKKIGYYIDFLRAPGKYPEAFSKIINQTMQTEITPDAVSSYLRSRLAGVTSTEETISEIKNVAALASAVGAESILWQTITNAFGGKDGKDCEECCIRLKRDKQFFTQLTSEEEYISFTRKLSKRAGQYRFKSVEKETENRKSRRPADSTVECYEIAEKSVKVVSDYLDDDLLERYTKAVYERVEVCIADDVKAEYSSLEEPKDYYAFQNFKRKAEQLIRCTDNARSDTLKTVHNDIAQRLSQMKEKFENGTKIREMIEKRIETLPYFESLEDMYRLLREYELNKEETEKLERAVRRKCPRTRREFLTAYERYYAQPFSATEAFGKEYSAILIKDIKPLYDNLELEENLNADGKSLLWYLDMLETEAATLCGMRNLSVRISGRRFQLRELRSCIEGKSLQKQIRNLEKLGIDRDVCEKWKNEGLLVGSAEKEPARPLPTREEDDFCFGEQERPQPQAVFTLPFFISSALAILLLAALVLTYFCGFPKFMDRKTDAEAVITVALEELNEEDQRAIEDIQRMFGIHFTGMIPGAANSRYVFNEEKGYPCGEYRFQYDGVDCSFKIVNLLNSNEMRNDEEETVIRSVNREPSKNVGENNSLMVYKKRGPGTISWREGELQFTFSMNDGASEKKLQKFMLMMDELYRIEPSAILEEPVEDHTWKDVYGSFLDSLLVQATDTLNVEAPESIEEAERSETFDHREVPEILKTEDILYLEYDLDQNGMTELLIVRPTESEQLQVVYLLTADESGAIKTVYKQGNQGSLSYLGKALFEDRQADGSRKIKEYVRGELVPYTEETASPEWIPGTIRIASTPESVSVSVATLIETP